ncbi:MAG TPA: HlyD family efflux transporter periplasmic adaptor subunit [Rhizomicrobium sp.]|jgi:HlyD family secretion protein|nr:HlyD family efflux transporter periplasmic adaptor subunit [Rhizomicrobium sp.]
MKKWIALSLTLLLAACEEKKDAGWLGYGEGDAAFIAAPQPGWIEELAVERGRTVKPGDLLFVLDTTAQEASQGQAEATLTQTKASLAQEQSNLVYMRTELTRQNGLARANAGTPVQRDQALTNYQQSLARIAQLKAQIAQMQAALTGASYSLSQRRVVAETGGPVQDIYFRPGEYVPASTPVVSILPPANVYVRFFVPQSQLAGVKLGDHVEVDCDGCKPMRAEITFIAAQVEFTPPVIFSVENREKLVFKLEARGAGGLAIHPGQPVTVKKI